MVMGYFFVDSLIVLFVLIFDNNLSKVLNRR